MFRRMVPNNRLYPADVIGKKRAESHIAGSYKQQRCNLYHLGIIIIAIIDVECDAF